MAVSPADALTRVQARRMDRAEQAAFVAAREAWTAAGAPEVEPERLAVAMGTGIGGVNTLLDQDDLIEERGPGKVSPLTVPMLMPNGPAAWISIEYGARAGVFTPVSACASGAEALALGARLIRDGEADVVIAGGTEAAIQPADHRRLRAGPHAEPAQRRPGGRVPARSTRPATGSSSARAPAR